MVTNVKSNLRVNQSDGRFLTEYGILPFIKAIVLGDERGNVHVGR